MILIVGATGALGRATALALLAQGHAVRALVRDRSRAVDLQRAGAALALGDLTDPRSLELACKGVDRVFACAHSLLGRGNFASAQVDHVGHSALVVAAREAKVERFVYTSMLGARADHPIDFGRTKNEIEAVVKGSGMGFTILRPSAFMESHVHQFNGQMLLERGFTVIIGPGPLSSQPLVATMLPSASRVIPSIPRCTSFASSPQVNSVVYVPRLPSSRIG